MIGFGRPFVKTLACSFCGKSQHDVRRLVAGPAVFICDECVTVCVNTIRDFDDIHGEVHCPSPSDPARRRILHRLRAWFGGSTRFEGDSHLVGVLK
jgi:hypothetical protein